MDNRIYKSTFFIYRLIKNNYYLINMLPNIVDYPFLIRIFNKIFTDQDKIKIISLNKYLNNKKTKFTYDKQIKIDEYFKNLWYYDRLTNISVDEGFKFPRFVTHLTIRPWLDGTFTFYEGCIPNSITHLKFDEDFNQPVFNYIPNSVTHLMFMFGFNQDIKKSIPNSVTNLTFIGHFNQNIEGCIPSSVTHLTLSCHFDQPLNNIPNSVTHLKLSFYLYRKCIPNSVTHLELERGNYEDLIPNSVTHLKILPDENQNLKNCIPNSVKILDLGIVFNNDIENVIPDSVEYLELGDIFNKSIGNLKNVIHLKFNVKNSNKFSEFPLSLRYLYASEKFIKINKETIPHKVKIIIINKKIQL